MARTGVIEIEIICQLDSDYFLPWEEVTEEQRAVFKDKSTRCDGDGNFSGFCIGCDFCEDWNMIDWYKVVEMSGRERVGLWHVDGKYPNLALMKLSSWLKAQGHETYLQRTPDHTTAYGSVVFTENKPRVEFWLRAHPDIKVGGSGWDLETELSPEIEALRPDYDLYGIRYGMGFLSRGCIRSCPFCIVQEKEGRLRQVAQLADLLNPLSNFLVILDNNLLGLPNALDVLVEITNRGLTVNISQGLDIRLITPEMAQALAKVHYTDFSRHNRTLHFAFDDTKLEKKVRQGINMLFEAGIPSEHLCFYVLAGFGDGTPKDVIYRCDVLRNYGIRPYVMRYRKTRKLNAIARWANATAGLWRKPFSEYKVT